MTHYICTGGCGGSTDVPGVCQAETCPKHGAPLTACDCTDGEHFGLQDLHKTEKDKEEENNK